ncbi:MAG: primase [Clostridiales bacterium]|jgi:DNA primase|nr:primase [Clostridiales bacterium]
MSISPDYIQELSQRTDITELIGSYVQLRRRGRTYTGLCPFHSEKTPSFVVYPETTSFYCFGCGAGGDAITFIKRLNNLDYVEAVRFLASRAGMPAPDEQDDVGNIKRRILAMNKDVARFYFDCLNADMGREARRYLRGRALTDGTIRRFGLGYSPPGYYDTSNHLKKLGYTEEEMLAGGVIKRGQRGGTYDFFHDRVMFPIIDLRGNVIAFGGRRMGDEGGPKYLNSGDTPVFKKSRNMFALNVAKKSKSRRYILCEGYMDAIALHQGGFDTAVAPLGTAFTTEQARLLSNYADELVLSYDSDEAGQKATRRAIGMLATEPVKVSILTVQGAKDPDEFLKKYGPDRFRMLLDGCSNAIEYELSRAKAKYDVTKPDGRVGYLKDAVEILSGRMSATEREVYIGRVAEETDVDKKAVQIQVGSKVRNKSREANREWEKELLKEGLVGAVQVPFTLGGQKAQGVALAELQLVTALVRQPGFLPMATQRLTPERFLLPETKEIFSLLLAKQQQGVYVEMAQLSGELSQSAFDMLNRLLAKRYDYTFTEDDLQFYIDRIEEGVPLGSRAAEMSEQDIEGYLQQLKNKRK